MFKGVTISNTTTDVVTNAVTFCGHYSPLSVDAADKTMLYLSADNTLCTPTAETAVGAFRAVFELNSTIGIDLNTLTDIVVGKTETTEAADVNGDTQVSIADVATLIDRLVKGGVKVIESNVEGLSLGTNGSTPH